MTKNYLIHSDEEIRGIRKAAEATAYLRDSLVKMIAPGMTTGQIDNFAKALIDSTGGVSAFFGYHGFPGQVCISVNDEVVHGIGNTERVLQKGDIVSIDQGIKLNGFIGDTAKTIYIGDDSEIPEDIDKLMRETERALNEGIKVCESGNYIRDIGAAVEKVAKSAKLGIVREYVGHGCGVELHEPPEIPNWKTKASGPKLHPGMVICIEPMLNLGTHKVYTEKDKWTIRTKDGKFSAHFEHMILITDKKPEILTWQKM